MVSNWEQEIERLNQLSRQLEEQARQARLQADELRRSVQSMAKLQNSPPSTNVTTPQPTVSDIILTQRLDAERQKSAQLDNASLESVPSITSELTTPVSVEDLPPECATLLTKSNMTTDDPLSDNHVASMDQTDKSEAEPTLFGSDETVDKTLDSSTSTSKHDTNVIEETNLESVSPFLSRVEHTDVHLGAKESFGGASLAMKHIDQSKPQLAAVPDQFHNVSTFSSASATDDHVTIWDGKESFGIVSPSRIPDIMSPFLSRTAHSNNDTGVVLNTQEKIIDKTPPKPKQTDSNTQEKQMVVQDKQQQILKQDALQKPTSLDDINIASSPFLRSVASGRQPSTRKTRSAPKSRATANKTLTTIDIFKPKPVSIAPHSQVLGQLTLGNTWTRNNARSGFAPARIIQQRKIAVTRPSSNSSVPVQEVTTIQSTPVSAENMIPAGPEVHNEQEVADEHDVESVQDIYGDAGSIESSSSQIVGKTAVQLSDEEMSHVLLKNNYTISVLTDGARLVRKGIKWGTTPIIDDRKTMNISVARHIDQERDSLLHIDISNYNLNYIFVDKDERDLQFKTIYTGIDPNYLPSSIDLRSTDDWGAIYDQGTLGACAVSAVAYCIRWIWIKHRSVSFDPSRLFIYYNARKLANLDVHEDTGISIRNALSCVATYSVCSERSWPYIVRRFSTEPPQSAYKSAPAFQEYKYLHLDLDPKLVKKSIKDGYPVVFAMAVYDSFMTSDVAKSGFVPVPQLDKDVRVGTQTMTVVGYDDDKKHIIACNSWSKSWGDLGFCYIPYQYFFNDMMIADLWTIRAKL